MRIMLWGFDSREYGDEVAADSLVWSRMHDRFQRILQDSLQEKTHETYSEI